MNIYIRLLILSHYLINKSGLRAKGLGVAQKLLIHDFIFKAFGKKFYYDSDIEGSYDYLLIGRSNEPETWHILDKIFSHSASYNFIDVGASIGEFVTAASCYNNIQAIYAFEPRPGCAEVLRRSARLNNEERIQVFEFAVDDKGEGDIAFHLNAGGNSSGFFNISDHMVSRSIEVKTITLDQALPASLTNPIFLVDVEGAEPLVLRGGQNFIKLNKPLIIFEYNLTSKQHYRLDEIVDILDEGYDIYRLKNDGNLDMDFDNSYNCVAIPRNSVFSTILQPLIKQPV
jgi:FkbM family methyltransferase